MTRQDETYEKRIMVEGETAEGTWQRRFPWKFGESFVKKEEKEKLKKEAKSYLDQKVTGENSSLAEIKKRFIFSPEYTLPAKRRFSGPMMKST